MTGKDMLQGIQNLDAELIEESEFGTFGRGKARGFGDHRDKGRKEESRFRDGQRHHRHPRPDADGSVRRQSHFPH